MEQNSLNQISSFSQLRLARVAVFSAILLIFLISAFSVSTALAIDAPNPLTPTYGTIGTVINYPPLGVPTFKWSAVEGATRYKLQISNDIGFTGTNTREFQTDNIFFVPQNLGNLVNNFADGVWYWRVRVEASPDGASSYSQTMMFEKRWSDNNAPMLASPSDYANIDFYEDITFSWNHVIGAAKYRFQVATSFDGFNNPIYNITTLNIRHQPLTRWANGTYYWRVLPLDATEVAGTSSEVRVFYQNYNNVPSLIEPEDNSEPIFTPTFRWTAVEGAQKYRLQYSTSNDFTTGTTTVFTPNTSYTPLNALANNQNIYWRVRVESGNSITDWSTVYSFVKKWIIQPQLLTPPNGYQHENHPLFSWVPVPGASYYKIEIARNSTFTDGRREGTTSNPFYTPNGYEGADYSWYWRVTPYDKNNNQGQTSTTFSYDGYYKNLAPDQVYPLYYYEPNNYPYPADNVTMNQYEDRTVPLPLFVWLRTHNPFDETDPGDAYPDAYRLQVATDQNFSSVVWTVDTENTNAVPLNTSEFNPNASTTYYWRVCPLVGGTCSTDGSARTYWSQVWKTHIDLSQGLDPVANIPVLLQPAHGSEHAELTPWFEWQPVTNATLYEIQISRDSSFSTFDDTATTEYPVYSPTDALAQRSLTALNFHTYYWRVRAIFGSTPGNWSDTRRFQVAAQSQWTVDRSTIGTELLEIGTDSSGDIGTPAYDVTKLYAAQDQSFWYFGFDVPTYSGTNVNYALYLDTNHYDGTGWLGDPSGPGGTSDPLSYSISTIPAHRPEFVLYIKQIGGVYNASEVYLYSWNGSGWSDYTLLSNLGASSITLDGNYVEIKVLNTAIGDIAVDGSYAISLMSFSITGGSQPQDSVPSDPNIPSSSQVSRFSSVTEKMTLAAPFNNLGGANHTYSSVQPYFWNWSARAPWAGEIVEVSLDQEFTAIIKEYRQDSNTSFWGSPFQFSNNDIGGDDTYYWRVQPLYTPTHHPGVWSEPFRFERVGFIPQNLQTSVTFATPTFSWDMAEGAHQYQLEVDNDPNFGSPEIRIDTAQISYTPVRTLANGTYYWRVRVERWGGIDNDWSPTQNFTLSLPTPSNLRHTPSPIPDRAPTLCWDHIMEDDGDGHPVLAAWKYRLLISLEPGFSTTVDNITTEQPCFTPTKGYADGDYYWRVAMIDGENKLGAYSPTSEFTKQYPVTTLIAPTGLVTQTPMFEWTPVNGAASYRIEISKYDTFAPLYDSATLNNTRFTPTKIYDNSTTYYWRVAMIDKENKYGPFTGEEIIIDESGSGYKIYLPLLLR